MAAGFRVRNANGILQIDQQFVGLAFSEKIIVTCTSTNIPGTNTPQTGHFSIPADQFVIVGHRSPQQILITSDGATTGMRTYKVIVMSTSNPHYAELYIFRPPTGNQGNKGLRVWNDQGQKVFDSNFKYVKVIDIANDEMTPYDRNPGPIWSATRNYPGYNIITATLARAGGRSVMFNEAAAQPSPGTLLSFGSSYHPSPSQLVTTIMTMTWAAQVGSDTSKWLRRHTTMVIDGNDIL